MQYLSLDEYERLAKTILIKSYPIIAQSFIKDNDKLGEIISVLIEADWKFDNRGSLFGYRKQMVDWMIKKMLKRRSHISLEQTYQANIPNKVNEIDEVDKEDEISYLIKLLNKNKKVTNIEKECIVSFLVDKVDIKTLATQLNLRRSTVVNYIKTGIDKLGLHGTYIKRL